MKITREDLPQREVLLSIEVEPGDLSPYLERAYRRVVGRVNIPGFRKGKAPRAVLERFIGQEALLDEAVDLLMPEVVERAVAQEKIEQGGIPSVEVAQKEPVVLKATVPMVPKVVLDAYRDIRVPVEMVEVKEEEVQELVEHLRSETALWEPAGRPVALGDQVTLDVRAQVGGRGMINQRGVVYLAAEDNPSPVPGFAQQLVGIEPGSRKEFAIAIPQDYQDTRLAGQQCTFQVAVHEVKAKRLPEMNDEFAKGVGQGYDSLEALKAKIREDLRASKEREAQRRYEEAVVEQLLSKTSVEYSPLVVEHETDHLLHDEQEALQRQQVSIDQYLESVGKKADEHREELRGIAMARLKRTYALRNVAELEGIKAAAEEVEEELSSLVKDAGPRAESLRRGLDTPDGRESVAQLIVRRKVMERLGEIAKGQRAGSTVPVLGSGVGEESSLGGEQDAGTSG
ncbi:MAG: trigger factor [Chloroflexi bacterium]|nr:trigger factor [Chloroflexota bacterium]